MISLEHLSKTFEGGSSVHALNDVSLTIPDGDVFGIIGISGAGKSTLVRCLNLLERPTSGRVVVDGVDVTNLKGAALREYRRHVAMIFQGFGLLAQKTALENVCFPYLASTGKITAENRKEALGYLDRVGLADRAGSYPAQLSGGQQQRVGIARALAVNPQVILFDEPTSALDPELVGEVLSVIRDVAKKLKVTMIIVTHEIAFAREVADQIVFMEGGSVVETGTPEEVLVHPREERTKAFLNRYLGGNVLRDGAGI